MGRNIAYARVSTQDQDLDLQLRQLKSFGCTKIFTDKASGVKADRKGLEQCISYLEPGDTLVVWKLDRLGRSMNHLVSIVNGLKERGIGFRSLRDGHINTDSPAGELVFHIFSALAQFERDLIRERTKAGLEAARARGKVGGRKAVEPTDPKVLTAIKMHKDQTLSINEICSSLQISRATFYRYLKLQQEDKPK